MATYVNDLRLKEITTGDESGTWGTSTNTNLELIAEAFSYGTEVITTNADTHTTTIADGATDPGRSLYLKYTGTLDSACTITIGPDTVSKVWIIENGTSGSQNIIISQGSGANITIPAGDTKVVYSDGAGAGAAFVDAFASLSVVDLKVQDDLTVTGDIDVDGTTNLDVVDIDGAVDMASTALVTGVLTANGGAVFNETGADVDFRVESDTVDHALFVQGSDGNVGIGTSSPAAPLSIEGSSTGEYDALILRNSNAAASGQSAAMIFEVSSGTSGTEAASVAKISGLRTGSGSTGDLLFHTTNAGVSAEAMRIDSSGNLLLNTTSSPTTTKAIISSDYSAAGTTNTGLTITGRQGGNWYNNGIHALGSSGLVFSTGTTGVNGADATNERMRIDASGNVSFTTSGGIIKSIGGDVSLVQGAIGLRINDAGSALSPTTASANSDAAVDLGVSNIRFKDLYLSGGVYLGGTGAANKLDDYEEGTWVIGLTFGSANVGMTTTATDGAYTKVGNLVTCTGYFALSAKGSSTGDAVITGLPFTISSINGGYSALSIRNIRISFADALEGNTVKAGTTVALTETTNAGAISTITDGDFTNDSGFIMSVTYRTD
jgi:hypothetical protein